jgi:hypothetical protein
VTVALAFPALALATAAGVGAGSPTAPPDDVLQVGTAQKVCQLTGNVDHQLGKPLATPTGKDFGLLGTDNGYSFDFDGKLWFLFGDSTPTPEFKGSPDGQSDPPRTTDDNDSMASAAETPADGTCPTLSFVPDSIGAYTNPVVDTTASQKPVTLRTNEVPLAGIAEDGHMYVLFGTDNTASNPSGGPGAPDGGPTRSVMGELEDASTLHFSDLYDFSSGSDAKFISAAIAQGLDGYVYVWGAEGGTTGYRHSPLFLARKRAARIGDAGGLSYFAGFRKGGGPKWVKDDESAATPVFSEASGDCLGEHSVQWDPYVERWILLYNCANDSASNPRGIWMRTADEPWGPWTPPHTLFPTSQGLCGFIHRAVKSGQPQCDDLSTPARLADQGGDYSPYILPSWTSGTYPTKTSSARSTIYFTMSTWNPYEVVLMTATIGGPAPPHVTTTVPVCKPVPPPKANPCA